MLFLFVDFLRLFLLKCMKTIKCNVNLDYVVISTKYAISCIKVQFDSIFIFGYIEMSLF